MFSSVMLEIWLIMARLHVNGNRASYIKIIILISCTHLQIHSMHYVSVMFLCFK